MSSLDSLLSFIIQNENIFGYSILFVSSIIEYIFPPFPGDTVTLFGAFLVAARGWNFYWVFSTATLGSVVGSSIDYFIGHRIRIGVANNTGLGRGINSRFTRFLTKERVDYIKNKIDRYGPAYIMLNRFMPGIRAFFFFAAGAAGMNFLKVTFYNLISVIVWNLIIISVGIFIGSNWPRLFSIFEAYSKIIAALIVLVVAFLLVKVLFFKKAKEN